MEGAGNARYVSDDDTMLPLQAADLLAWGQHMRQDPNLKTRKPPWLKKRAILGLGHLGIIPRAHFADRRQLRCGELSS